jgi:hypothetical protein
MCYQNATAFIYNYQEITRFPDLVGEEMYQPRSLGKPAAFNCCLKRNYKENIRKTALRLGCAAISVNHQVYTRLSLVRQFIFRLTIMTLEPLSLFAHIVVQIFSTLN